MPSQSGVDHIDRELRVAESGSPEAAGKAASGVKIGIRVHLEDERIAFRRDSEIDTGIVAAA